MILIAAGRRKLSEMLKGEIVDAALAQAFNLIPGQGPLEFFVHHNTLHHHQHLDFFTAVKKAASDYKCNAFMHEEFYWQEYTERGINKTELFYEIDRYIQQNQLKIPNHIFYRLIIQKKTANQYLSNAECNSIREHFKTTTKAFYQSAIRTDFSIDIENFITPVLLKFLSHFFDSGAATWPLEDKDSGIWHSFCAMHAKTSLIDSKFLKTLSTHIASFKSTPPKSALLSMLLTLKIKPEDLANYLFQLIYRYKGWAGLIKSLIHHPEWMKNNSIKIDLLEFVSILVLCEFAAIKTVTNEIPAIPRYETTYLHSEQFIHHFFYELFKHPDLYKEFTHALYFLTDLARQEVLHKAFERTFYNQFLNAYVTQPQIFNSAKIAYQVICCLDEREESFRRYLEQDKECQTFGHAGHFGLNINFKGYFVKHPRSLCPIAAKPEFLVTEIANNNIKITPNPILYWAEILWIAAFSSKTIFKDSLQAFCGCILNVIPFTLDMISPRLTAKVKHKFVKLINKNLQTDLKYKKAANYPLGMDLKDRVKVAANFLVNIGLTKQFAPFIILMGHGSSSLNNPHEAAYDCGACGGGRGGANSRLMALILNEAKVKEELKMQGIVIPKNTQFIGAYHNTCSDEVSWYLTDSLINPKFKLIQQRIHQATQLNAKERCRRFSAIPYHKKPAYYLGKTLERSIDLRQPRPEYGHSTNALCIIGPRSYSKNLFLDRRAFLISYDPLEDKNGIILQQILSTAALVCAGINLEYFFSYIDNETYGCGTKLPHNVTALIGVMNGYLSDLQTGLTSQMIEIHQHIRLCVLIISSLAILKKLLNEANEFTQLVKNQWISLFVHDIEDDNVYCYCDSKFIRFTKQEFPPSYFHQDEDIFTHANNLNFGHITL